MKKIFIFTILILVINSCSLAGKNFGNLGFFSYLLRIKPPECLTYSKTINYTSSNGANNSYTCNYKPDSISMECNYTNAIVEDNTPTTTKIEFYNSTEDFILRAKNFGISTVRYSQINKNISTNKFFQYDASNRLTNIIQSDGSQISISEYDTNGRYTKGSVYSPTINCSIPFTNTYDDANLTFRQNIFFSQLSPSNNFICSFFSTLVPDQALEIFVDKNYLLSKKIYTLGSSVTTELYTTVETAQACTGTDGTPYTAPIIQKLNSKGGSVGETVSITGINFDPDPGANTIQFSNGMKTFGSSATNSSLSFIIPAGASSGQLTITNRYGTAISKDIFFIYKYFIYAGNSLSNSVSGFEIDISNGALINPSTLGIGNQPGSLIANPNGKFAYIINQSILAVNSVSINPSNGFLSNISTANAGNGARSAAIAYSGNLLFVLNQTDNTISRFYIDPNTGGIANIGTAIATGVTAPYTIVAHPSLPFLYVTGSTSTNVSAFIIDLSTGNLVPIAGSPFAMSADPSAMTIHPNGLYLYTGNNSSTNSVSRFSINQLTGALSGEISYSSVFMESEAIDPSGKFLFSCSLTNNLIQSFQINQSNGTLTSVGSIAANQCRSVIVDPTGKYVYATEDVGGSNGKLNKYTIQANGSLSSVGFIALGTNNPRGMMIVQAPR